VGKARGLPQVPVVGTVRTVRRALGVVATARALPGGREDRLPHCHSSNARCRTYKDAPWEIWLVPRFPSCKLASHKPVTARS